MKGSVFLHWIFAVLAGAATGVLSAFGVGGGTLLLIFLSVFAGVPQQTAQGINLLYFLPASSASLPSHFRNGVIESSVLLPAICFGVLSTAGFAWLATAMETELLRRFFGVFLLSIGFWELFGPRKESRTSSSAPHSSRDDEDPC